MVAGDFNGASRPPSPTPLWDLEGLHANGLTYLGLSSRSGLNRNGSFGNTGHLTKIGRIWVCRQKTRHATTRVEVAQEGQSEEMTEAPGASDPDRPR